MKLRFAGALALAVTALAPAAAQAASCTTSTPAQQRFADASGDSIDGNGQPDPLGYAPDIEAIEVSLDDRCNLTIGARLSDHVQASHTLYDGEVIAFFLNTDGNATTGVAGSERVIVTTGSKFGPDLTRVGTSNGSGFDFQGVSTEAAPWGRQTLSLDTLGITAPATIELRTVGIFDSSFYDFAPPDDGAFQFVIPPPPIRPIDPPPPPPKPENPGTSGQSRPSAVRRIRYEIDHQWRYKRALTRVTRLVLRSLDPATRVTVRCAGASCPFRTWSTSGRKRVDLEPRFGGRFLRSGTRIQIRLTSSGRRDRVLTFTTRKNALPRMRTK